jgi:hypothetical protein
MKSKEISLTKEVKYLCTENYKTDKKNPEKYASVKKDSVYHELEYSKNVFIIQTHTHIDLMKFQ